MASAFESARSVYLRTNLEGADYPPTLMTAPTANRARSESMPHITLEETIRNFEPTISLHAYVATSSTGRAYAALKSSIDRVSKFSRIINLEPLRLALGDDASWTRTPVPN